MPLHSRPAACKRSLISASGSFSMRHRAVSGGNSVRVDVVMVQPVVVSTSGGVGSESCRDSKLTVFIPAP